MKFDVKRFKIVETADAIALVAASVPTPPAALLLSDATLSEALRFIASYARRKAEGATQQNAQLVAVMASAGRRRLSYRSRRS